MFFKFFLWTYVECVDGAVVPPLLTLEHGLVDLDGGEVELRQYGRSDLGGGEGLIDENLPGLDVHLMLGADVDQSFLLGDGEFDLLDFCHGLLVLGEDPVDGFDRIIRGCVD